MINEKIQEILSDVGHYYTDKLRVHGAVAKGVDWNSQESQELRFTQLLKVCDLTKTGSINDIGCGFGHLYRFLQECGSKFSYFGADISEEMIAEARRLFSAAPGAQFYSSAEELPVSDYSTASGIFNVKLSHSLTDWEQYLESMLHLLNRTSRKGFSFNMLTSYSDSDKMRPDLYYADPCRYFDYCKRQFSKNVALLHDYNLYEFTLLVRKSP